MQPRLAALPAEADQKVGGRGERVRNTFDQVAAPVAVEVDRILEIVGSGELHAAEFAGPVADHVLDTLVAALDDTQRIEQLLAEELRTPAIIGKRRDRTQNIVLAEIRAEVAFESPERGQNWRRHAILLLDARKQRRVLFYLGEPGRNTTTADHAVGELQECLVEDRLAVVAADDRLIEHHAGSGRVDDPRGNALRSGLFLKILEPALVTAAGTAGGGGERVPYQDGAEDGNCRCQYRFSHRPPTHLFEGLSG